jgi:hypothetical protein
MNVELKLNGTTEEVVELLNARERAQANFELMQHAQEELRQRIDIAKRFFAILEGQTSLFICKRRDYEDRKTYYEVDVAATTLRHEDPWELMCKAVGTYDDLPASVKTPPPGSVVPVPEGVAIEDFQPSEGDAL